MLINLSRPFQLISLCLFAVTPFANANATQQGNPPGVTFTRQITFQLTFSHDDMVWLGDPASPTASVYPKPDAHPIATDMCVRTLAKDLVSPSRRYLHEARIAKGTSQRNVYAFTSEREKMIGTINGQGHFLANATYRNNRKLLPSWPTDASALAYDAEENRLYYNVQIPGPLVSESLDFLPLTLVNSDHNRVTGRYSIDYSISNGTPATDSTAKVSLQLATRTHTVTLAHATVPRVFHGDDCYFGVDIGDDCEVQFEFVDNNLRKTFYGFCGIGGDDNVLKQKVTLGKSQYGRFNKAGVERANYKSEYIFRDGVTQITEDLKLGTSDTIRLAVSPDGNEVEVVSTFTGFLRNPEGQPTIQPGQTIDLAVGMECDSKAYPGKTNWAADSTKAIRGYTLGHSGRHATSK